MATLAELAFVAQWAILLREAGAGRAALGLALIVMAEVLSWLAVLTQNDLFHATENSIWTLTAAIAVGFFASRASAPHTILAGSGLRGGVRRLHAALRRADVSLARGQAYLG